MDDLGIGTVRNSDSFRDSIQIEAADDESVSRGVTLAEFSHHRPVNDRNKWLRDCARLAPIRADTKPIAHSNSRADPGRLFDSL